MNIRGGDCGRGGARSSKLLQARSKSSRGLGQLPTLVHETLEIHPARIDPYPLLDKPRAGDQEIDISAVEASGFW